MSIKIQFASDLHVDINFSKKKFIDQKGDILCLLGNICSCGSEKGLNVLRDFLARECCGFKRVLFVAGNHEFYSKKMWSMDDIKIKLKLLETEIKNFIFLDDEILELCVGEKRLVFLGTTLWSYIPDHCKEAVKNIVNDYRFINVARCMFIDGMVKKFVRHLNVEDTQRMHMSAKEFISSSINYLKDKENVTPILLTHHKPIWDAHPHYNPYTNYVFQSDMKSIIVAPIVMAIHGRMCEPHNKVVNNIRILSNPYQCEKDGESFNSSMCIDPFEE
jgi:hypothetical protein